MTSTEAQRDSNKIDHILANHGHAVRLPSSVWPKPVELTWASIKETRAWKHHSRHAPTEIITSY